MSLWTDGSYEERENHAMGAAAILNTFRNNVETTFEIVQARVPDSPAACSNPAEIYAIYIALHRCLQHGSHFTVTIYTDSQFVILGHKTFSRTKFRDKLKYSHHATFDAVMHLISLFDTPPKFEKVKAHSIDTSEFNELADKYAKAARLLPHENITPLEPPLNNPNAYHYLHSDGTLHDVYPTKLLKKRFLVTQSEASTKYITDKYEEDAAAFNALNATPNSPAPSVPTLNITLTKHITYKGKGKTNRLHASHSHYRGFSHKIIHGDLPSLVVLVTFTVHQRAKTSPLCRRCFKEPESQQHILLCDAAIDAYRLCHETATSILNDEPATLLHWKQILKAQPDVTTHPSAHWLLSAIGATNDLFMSNYHAAAHGFITDDLSKSFKDLIKQDHIEHAQNWKLWLELTIDAWLHGIYKNVWLPRNKATYLSKKEIRAAYPHLTKAQQKQKHNLYKIRPIPAGATAYDSPGTKRPTPPPQTRKPQKISKTAHKTRKPSKKRKSRSEPQDTPTKDNTYSNPYPNLKRPRAALFNVTPERNLTFVPTPQHRQQAHRSPTQSPASPAPYIRPERKPPDKPSSMSSNG